MVNLFEDSNLVASCARRNTLLAIDLQLVRYLRSRSLVESVTTNSLTDIKAKLKVHNSKKKTTKKQKEKVVVEEDDVDDEDDDEDYDYEEEENEEEDNEEEDNEDDE